MPSVALSRARRAGCDPFDRELWALEVVPSLDMGASRSQEGNRGEGCTYSIPLQAGLLVFLDTDRMKEGNASIARFPGSSNSARSARSRRAPPPGSRDHRAPTSSECASATGQTAPLSTLRSSISRRRGSTTATGSLGAVPGNPKVAASMAPRAGAPEMGSIPKASCGPPTAAGRAAGADPAPSKGEPEMRLQTHPGRA
jgi:hypothetical protein